MAFRLFGEFFQEVVEFRQAVGQMSVANLKYKLKLHKYCQSYATDLDRDTAVALIGHLTTLPQFSDWRDLVVSDEHDDVDKMMQEMAPSLKMPKIPLNQGPIFPPPGLYFDRPIEKLMNMFKTSMTHGLDSNALSSLQAFYGLNHLPSPLSPSLFKMLMIQISDTMIIVLILASVISFATTDYKSGATLLAVILINIIIGFMQDLKANKAMEALRSLSVPKAIVIRDGTTQDIDATYLVPGDIVILDEGDAIPADLRLIEANHLEIVETLLTGESIPVIKSTEPLKTKVISIIDLVCTSYFLINYRNQSRKMPLGDCLSNAFMSTTVARGRGKALVVRTGEATEVF